MQNTNISERRQAQRAIFAIALREAQEIKVGKTYFHRNFRFEVLSDGEFETVISVRYNGRQFRTVSYWKSGYFRTSDDSKLTDALIEALCIVFVNFTETGAKNAHHLNLHRACVYQDSFRIQNGYKRKMANPFGV